MFLSLKHFSIHEFAKTLARIGPREQNTETITLYSSGKGNKDSQLMFLIVMVDLYFNILFTLIQKIKYH